MQSDIELFVKLKYEIITRESETWKLCETYPLEVRSKWAWRCAADAEHLAKWYPRSAECIRVAKAFRDGLATIEELDKAYVESAKDSNRGFFAAYSAFYAAYTALSIAPAANCAACAAHYAEAAFLGDIKKWNLYISWLIEELCEWELKQQ